MDYGIGATLEIALKVYGEVSRQSGRTTLALRALRDGDIFVAHNAQMVDYAKHFLIRQEPKIKVEVMTLRTFLARPRVDPARVVIDHYVIERMYAESIRSVADEFGRLSRPDFIRSAETPVLHGHAPTAYRTMSEVGMLKDRP